MCFKDGGGDDEGEGGVYGVSIERRVYVNENGGVPTRVTGMKVSLPSRISTVMSWPELMIAFGRSWMTWVIKTPRVILLLSKGTMAGESAGPSSRQHPARLHIRVTCITPGEAGKTVKLCLSTAIVATGHSSRR